VNSHVIETQNDLEIAVQQVLSARVEPAFRIKRGKDSLWDFEAQVTLDGKRHPFGIDCKLRPGIRDVRKLSGQRTRSLSPLLATVEATTSLVEHCKRLNVSCVDLNGRIWLRAEGILIDREEPRVSAQFRTAEPPVNSFSLKGSRLVRALLSFPGRQWRQKELADFTGLSQGLLSRLLKQANLQGWVEGSRGDWTVTNADGLLDAWQTEDVWQKRVSIHQYSVLEGDLTRLAKRLLELATGQVAFTQWFAAGLRFPYADVPIVSAYVAEAPGAALVGDLAAREVSSGGNLWLIIPKDVGVFQAIRHTDGIPIVCDVQIYLDLLQVGLRGPDQAGALRSWKGFCQP